MNYGMRSDARNLGESRIDARLLAVLFATMTVTATLLASTSIVEAQILNCQADQQSSFKDNSVAVPCSNKTFCYTWTGNAATCTNGGSAGYYQNTNPPAGWCNCGPAAGTTMTCGEVSTSCGVTKFFTTNNCSAGTSCDVDFLNLQQCKCQ